MHVLGAMLCCGAVGVCFLSALVCGLEVPMNKRPAQRPWCMSLLVPVVGAILIYCTCTVDLY